MKVTPILGQANGIITVTFTASFVGDPTDASDQSKIAAFGDPLVDLVGTFTDPSNSQFSFVFPVSQLYVGITTQMQNFGARFMTQLPVAPPIGTPYNPYAPTSSWNPMAPMSNACGSRPQLTQGPLDCITSNPSQAASVWISQIESRIATSMAALRALIPAAYPPATTI